MSDVLSRFGIGEDALIGEGGESRVYAVDHDRVLRVPRRPGGAGPSVIRDAREYQERRRDLLDDLAGKAETVSFDIPRVLEIVETEDVVATIESRLPGESLDRVLSHATDRRALLRAYLLASLEIRRLTPAGDWFGDVLAEGPIRTRSFPEYALARAHDSLRRAGPPFDELNALELCEGLPDAPPALVHLDLVPANVLIEKGRVSGVLDFSAMSMIGDRRIEPISAALYLDPEITPGATDEDRSFAMTWLESNELLPLVDPVRRWLAAVWSASRADPRMDAWCRRLLL